jgi:hypothetical protein
LTNKAPRCTVDAAAVRQGGRGAGGGVGEAMKLTSQRWFQVGVIALALFWVSGTVWLFLPFDVEIDWRIPKPLVIYRPANIHRVNHWLGID